MFIQNLTAVGGFRSKGFKDTGYGLVLAVPAVLGAILGAMVAVDISDSAFEHILGILMLIILGLILWNPATRMETNTADFSHSRKLLAAGAFLLVGFYGGFIQAGVGVFIIATLTFIHQLDLVTTNSLKVVINSIFTFVALLVFALNGEVEWIVGFLLAIGMGIGGWLGSHLAVEKGEPLIKAVLAIAVVAMSLKLLTGLW